MLENEPFFPAAAPYLSSAAMSLELSSEVAMSDFGLPGLFLHLLRRYMSKPTIEAARSTLRGTPNPIPSLADLLRLDGGFVAAAPEAEGT